MNTEFFEALAMLEKERGVPMTDLTEKIKSAIIIGPSENSPRRVLEVRSRR